jgi:hypothetical protein
VVAPRYHPGYGLTVEDLLLIADTIGAAAVRDIGLLDAAAHRPRATAFGQEAYPTLHLKAAALLDAVVRNHALVDGDTRLGWQRRSSSMTSMASTSTRPAWTRR